MHGGWQWGQTPVTGSSEPSTLRHTSVSEMALKVWPQRLQGPSPAGRASHIFFQQKPAPYGPAQGLCEVHRSDGKGAKPLPAEACIRQASLWPLRLGLV